MTAIIPTGPSPFRDTFSIRHLEEFSGVKAHTIRIWEKRYGLLAPDRTGTNIRYYGLDELKVILNVAFLNKRGHKISRIAAMAPAERDRLVRSATEGPALLLDTLNALKLAMLAFDAPRFREVGERHREAHGFRSLMEDVYGPLLDQIGTLWQTNAICPAQEHFVSNLIRHQLIEATAALTPPRSDEDRTYVLFLPENEIHELGLLYVEHVLRTQGIPSIYLGQSVPSADLGQVAHARHGSLTMVTLLTVAPTGERTAAYLERLRREVPDRRVTFMVVVPQGTTDDREPPPGVGRFASLKELVLALERLHGAQVR